MPETIPEFRDERKRLSALIAAEGLQCALQPIVDLRTGETLGFEGLARPDEQFGFPHPGALFGAAERHHKVWEVEALARRRVVEQAAADDSDHLYFLNNSPDVFCHPDYVESMECLLAEYPGLHPSRFVLEVTEHMRGEGLDEISSRRLCALREMGYQVAIDDVGAGTSGLNRIMSARPDWLKLDLNLISGLDHDPFKQNLMRFFVSFARMSNIRLIAEGIEEEGDLATLIDLGVSHGQGYLLGRPAPHRASVDADLSERIRTVAGAARARAIHDPRAIELGGIATAVPTFEADATVNDVLTRLQFMPRLDGVVVVCGQRFIGWLPREIVQKAALADRGDVPVGDLEIVDGGLVGPDMRLQEAFGNLCARPLEDLRVPLIVKRNDRTYAYASLRALLRHAAYSDWIASRVAPLTGLPNRVVADHWLADRIRAADTCHVAYIDIRQFNAYNAAYGYDMGDAMLKRLVGLIRGELFESDIAPTDDDNASFIAHIGEDRFMFATRRADARDRLAGLVERFEQSRGEFFSAEAIASGSYHSPDSTGVDRVLPLTTLRIVLLRSPLCRAADPSDVHALGWHVAARDALGNKCGSIITDEGFVELRRRMSA